MNKLFSAQEAGEVLGKSARWMRERANGGEIEFVRVGRSVMFTERALKSYVKGKTSVAFVVPDFNPWGRPRRGRVA